MSTRYSDHRKRPPPIFVPPLPYARPVLVTNPIQTSDGATSQQQQQQLQQLQHDARSATFSARQGAWSHGSSPMVSPPEQKASRRPRSSSQSRPAGFEHSQPRVSLRKSDSASTKTNQFSIGRSKHSQHSGRSVATMQDQLDVLDDSTSRGHIEARKEQKWFKISGQLPPTPFAGE